MTPRPLPQPSDQCNATPLSAADPEHWRCQLPKGHDGEHIAQDEHGVLAWGLRRGAPAMTGKGLREGDSAT